MHRKSLVGIQTVTFEKFQREEASSCACWEEGVEQLK